MKNGIVNVIHAPMNLKIAELKSSNNSERNGHIDVDGLKELIKATHSSEDIKSSVANLANAEIANIKEKRNFVDRLRRKFLGIEDRLSKKETEQLYDKYTQISKAKIKEHLNKTLQATPSL